MPPKWDEPGIAAGDLRHRVGLMAPPDPQDQDGRGEPADQDSLTADTWGLVEALTGHKLVVAQALAPEATWRVTIRWRPGMTTFGWVLWEGRRLNVVYVQPDPRKIKLELLCSSDESET